MDIESLGVRKRIEEFEENLSPFAVRSRDSKGRLEPEIPSPLRTEFQRDRDRIIHCNSFRRLKHKTQVFIAPVSDHFVTRLTHTLEVSQIARTISRALRLNEDLTEAIALGHDLGHTPFGHVGENVLNELSPDGFRHNEQSLRVIDILERDGQGLNLTWEVRDGILNHSKPFCDILGDGWGEVGTLEGSVCKIADVVAYVNHDTEDAIRAGLLSPEDIPEEVIRVLGNTHSERINTMVTDIVVCSWAVTGEVPSKRSKKPELGMSPKVSEASTILRDFLLKNVYKTRYAVMETERARATLRRLFGYFLEHSNELPEEYSLRGESVERQVIDYIAGMTDQFATRMAKSLPSSFKLGRY
jgi:dGTPase